MNDSIEIERRYFTFQETTTTLGESQLFLRLLSMSKPERMFILIGCIICGMSGATHTILAILLGKIINVSAID